MPNRLKIAIIPSGCSGVMFYRAYQPAEAIRDLGHDVALLWYSHDHWMRHPWEWDLDKSGNEFIRSDIEMACEWADSVVWMGMSREESVGLFHQMKLAHPDKPFLIESDDYIFSTPPENSAADIYRPGSPLIRLLIEQMREADGMIVSTPYLKELYAPYNDSIHVVENAIDSRIWPRRKHSKSKKVTIGWVGGGGHDRDHEVMKEAMFEVLYKNPNVTYSCLHGRPLFYKDNPQIVCPRETNGDPTFKPINKYPKWVSSHKFDIGVAPLQDNNFTRGKSNLRWLEYSIQGIPTVASPVMHFNQSIKEGKTGLFASSRKEWVEKLDCLIREPEIRENIGKAAYKEVTAKWNPRVMGIKYVSAIRSILNASPNTVDYPTEDRRHYKRSGQQAVVSL